jgi:hypothetical protein
MCKPGYSSLLGFQVQFYLHELSVQDRHQLAYNLIESLPREVMVKIRDDLDNYLESQPDV